MVLVLAARDRRAWRIVLPVAFLAAALWLLNRVVPAGDPDLTGHLGAIVAGVAAMCLLLPGAATFAPARRWRALIAVWLIASGAGAATLFRWGSMIAFGVVGALLLIACSLAVRSTRDPARARRFAGMLALWLGATVLAAITAVAVIMTRGELLAAPGEFVESCLMSSAIIATALFVTLAPFIILLVKDPYFRPGFAALFPAAAAAAADTPEETVT